MWHEMNYAFLPGDEGVLSMWSYHRTPPERRPAGRGWSSAASSPSGAGTCRLTGSVCTRPTKPCRQAWPGLGPTGASSSTWTSSRSPRRGTPTGLDPGHRPGQHARPGLGQRALRAALSGPRERRVWPDQVPFDGYGWRDHSQGPRGGGAGAPWGGHIITGTLYDSGRGWGLSRYWTPDGTISLEGGWVAGRDAVLHHAEVIDAPASATW